MIRWKRSEEGFVESHDGEWQITPEYWSCVRPQAFTLWRRLPDGTRKKVSFGCSTQRDAKQSADTMLANDIIRERKARKARK